jgi:formylglycine-generating enzyme required for sulfatase activity/energy-coupling factor transporter ATP-binding protein EcfA2
MPSEKTTTRANRDVIQGNQTNYTITQVIQLPAFVPPPDLEALRADYLSHLRRTYHVLDFRGIQQLESFSRELPLEDIYVPLVARPEAPGGDTWERVRRLAGRMLEKDAIPEEALALLGKGDSCPVRVEEALGEKPRVVVLGDPGSGKSTLLKYLALRLAAETAAPLPILVPLNAYARALRQGDVSLQAYLPRYFAGLAKGVADLAPLFEAALAKGQAVILLDGLDEVQDGRGFLVNKVETFAAETVARGNKLVVTSRIVGYKEAPLSREWTLYTLLDFDQEAIESFAAKWCLAFEKTTLGDTPEARQAAEVERRALLDSLAANPGVARLAANPLLLTILALIKRQGVVLPNRRVELYELYIETLIRSWNKARALDKQPIGPDLNPNEVLSTLGPLALWLRQENPTAGVVPEEALLQELTRHYMGEDWGLKRGPAKEKAHAFLESVRRYSNLLVERGPHQYGFLHLTFEEMLAAYGIYQRGQLDLEAALTVIREHLPDPAWRETLLLSVGVWGLANKQPRVAAQVVRAMLKMDCAGSEACQNVLLAGACLEDVGEEGLGHTAAGEIIEALTAASLNRDLPPATQRDAGLSLGRLAGSNPEMFARIRPDLDDWVAIPAGKFRYGGDDFPERDEIIKEPFSIAKYLVTNSQYRQFVNAGGYDKEEFWSKDGWLWRTGKWDTKADKAYQNWLKSRPAEKRSEPFYWHDQKWNNPLAPAVGVSWFEAEAYANWLSKKLGYEVRLPTEQEWERAARGVKGREYAWEGEFDRTRLNCAEFWGEDNNLDWNKWYDAESRKMASITQVGQFPAGATPEGVCDLSGNVWEWTDSWYEDKQVNRTVRGGSWFLLHRHCRCAFRTGLVPDDFSSYIGFRLVSPGSDVSPERSGGDSSDC